MVLGWSVPQYLHLDAAAGKSSDRHAGQVLTGGGSPNTTWPRRACTCCNASVSAEPGVA